MKHNLMALVLDGALKGYLAPRLAQDAGLDLRPIVKGVTVDNYQESKAQIKQRLEAATTGKLAQDADLSDVIEMLDALDDNKQQVAEAIAGDLPDAGAAESGPAALDADPAPPMTPVDPATPDDAAPSDDVFTRLMEFLKGKLSSEDMAQIDAILGDDDSDDSDDSDAPPDDTNDEPPVGDRKPMQITKAAMDAAIHVAVTKAEKDMVARQRAIREAEKAVQPFVGEITVAMDSASDVYKLALDAAKIDLKGVPPEAYLAMVRMLPRPGSEGPTRPTLVAMDEAAAGDFEKRYGKVSHLKHR